MKKINIHDNQTILDIALQYYGTAEAIGEILANNPTLKNDIKALIESSRDVDKFYPDIKLEVGSTLYIDDNSKSIKNTIVKQINRGVNTYITEQWQERLNK